MLVGRVGRLELRVPQLRHGRRSTALFERDRRAEQALAAIYVQGASTRKVKGAREDLRPSFRAAGAELPPGKVAPRLRPFAPPSRRAEA